MQLDMEYNYHDLLLSTIFTNSFEQPFHALHGWRYCSTQPQLPSNSPSTIMLLHRGTRGYWTTFALLPSSPKLLFNKNNHSLHTGPLSTQLCLQWCWVSGEPSHTTPSKFTIGLWLFYLSMSFPGLLCSFSRCSLILLLSKTCTKAILARSAAMSSHCLVVRSSGRFSVLGPYI